MACGLRWIEFLGEFRTLDRLALISNENRLGIDLRFLPAKNAQFARCCGCALADTFELRVMGCVFPLLQSSLNL
jgi:hypothetical protein